MVCLFVCFLKIEIEFLHINSEILVWVFFISPTLMPSLQVLGFFFFGSLPNLFFRIDIFLSAAALDPWTVDKYHPQAVVHAQNPHYKTAAGQRRSKSFQVHLVKYGTRFSVPGRRNQHVSLLLSGTPTSQSQVGDL